MEKFKTLYIAHPLRGNVKENIEKVTSICKKIALEDKVIPLSPIHAFSFMPTEGNQIQVMWYCINLLSKANEMWVFGDWMSSEGCRMEVNYARLNNIPIKFTEKEAI